MPPLRPCSRPAAERPPRGDPVPAAGRDGPAELTPARASAFARLALANVEREYQGADVLVLTHGGLVYELERDHGLPWERLPNLGGRAISLRGDRVEVHDRILRALWPGRG